jgi:beta-lactamase superfamily II metal-dependent hydrolase
MKITVFQSNKGDCLLLTSLDGHRLLVDGGMKNSYTEFVSPTLNQMREQGSALDVVYVSHIDEDHIAGILQLVDDEIQWRKHLIDKMDDTNAKPPKSLRPPEINEVWHNFFHAQLGNLSGGAINRLVTNLKLFRFHDQLRRADDRFENLHVGQSLFSSTEEEEEALFGEDYLMYRNLATSYLQGFELFTRISDNVLKIPINQPFNKGLIMVDTALSPVDLGAMSVRFLGPSQDHIVRLRQKWEAWEKDNQKKIQSVVSMAAEDQENLGLSTADALIETVQALAVELSGTSVTIPNLASIMLLVEEDSKSVLLTGDGDADDIIDGLELYFPKVRQDGIHVDVLKIQHHGSDHNFTDEFYDIVTADHYVFCGNGYKTNPELGVLDRLIDTRVNPKPKLAVRPKIDDPFKFWFNSSSGATTPSRVKHMQDVETLIETRAGQSGNKMEFRFLDKAEAKFEIVL